MKKHEIIFKTVKVPLDFIIIFFSFFIAREIRLITDLIPGINIPLHTIENNFLLPFALSWSFLYIILFASHNLYSSKIEDSKIKEFLDIIRYGIYWFIFFWFAVYLWNWIIYTTEIPRLIILFTIILTTTFVILQRILLNNLWVFLLKKWYIWKKKIILINNKKSSEIKYILEDIKNSKIYEIIGYLNKKELEVKNNTWNNSIYNIKYLWWIKELNTYKTDEILYIDSDFTKKELYKIWDYSRIFWIRYRYITNSFDITNSNTTLSLINNIAVIELKNTPLWLWWRVIKRLFDIMVSIFALIILSPLIIIISVLIKIDDPKWPIIFKNKRVWQDNKIFNLYKFRYLKWEYCIKECYWIDIEKDTALKYENKLIKEKSFRKWPLYKIKDDPRKTKIWTIIEKYSIDEIPQFVNVLLWNMSIIGPRPHQPREVSKYKIKQKRLLTIKPWITWMAQVNWREKNTFDDETALDIFYIENWNIILDLKIFFKTIWIIINK